MGGVFPSCDWSTVIIEIQGKQGPTLRFQSPLRQAIFFNNQVLQGTPLDKEHPLSAISAI